MCPLCKGAGSLITFAPTTWWQCSACGGAGVLVTSIVKPLIVLPRAMTKGRLRVVQ
jgi:DnaJ-class molecular chaperone